MAERLLKIGELAARAEVSTRTIDYYTSLGLLTPAERTPSNYRLYDTTAVDLVTTIRQLETHGVSLDEIASALTAKNTDVPALIQQLDRDLQALHDAVQTAGPEAHSLLAALTARAHSLITTALDIAAGMSPPL